MQPPGTVQNWRQPVTVVRTNFTSSDCTLFMKQEHHEQTETADAPSDRILPTLKLPAARPPCESPAGTAWRRGGDYARPHRVIRSHPRRRGALFKTGNRPVSDRGRRQGIRRRLELSQPFPAPFPTPSPSRTSFTFPASCCSVNGLDRNSTSSPAPSLSRNVSSV